MSRAARKVPISSTVVYAAKDARVEAVVVLVAAVEDVEVLGVLGVRGAGQLRIAVHEHDRSDLARIRNPNTELT